MAQINKIFNSKIKIPTPVFFIMTILVIWYVLPREGKYKYSYTENRPWQYGLLTAPFNFHIHKSDKQVQEEKDSIMRSYQPYYYTDLNISKKTVSQFSQDALAKSIPSEYISYVNRKLNEVYKAGIISAEDYDKVQQLNKKQLQLVNDNNVASTRHLASFYTPKQAYEKIISDAPSSVDISHLRAFNLNDYLNVNVLYDEKMSSNEKEELLKQVALYEGEVQSGEKIIDRGEIVDARTKNILDSYNREVESKVGTKSKPGWLMFGELVMLSLLLMSLMVYLKFYRLHEYNNRKNIIFILIMVGIFPIITGIMADTKMFSLMYLAPFAIPTILIRTFIDSRTAMTTHMITVLICALMLPLAQMAQFIVIQVMIGYMCIFSLRNLSERSQLVYCSILILLTYVITYTAWVLCTEGNPSLLIENGRMYIYFCINFVFVSFAYLLVYVCERVFGFISEVSMIELSNTNRPLLQELSEVAPGTFQHSMQVSTLVVSAAHRIGANATLVRTGALYHDIGKMVNPIFFTENQIEGIDPHAGLTEKESACIIIGHVAEGVKIARKYNLPQQIIDFIQTHHGKGKAKYFYNSYVNSHPDEEVDEEDFTYPGPNPFTRETALLMMADTIEAASRSLKDNSKEAISGLVNRLVDSQVADGLFKNAPITFKDIELAKEVFSEKLVSMRHMRVAYPELKKRNDETLIEQ
ncbi:MULTISPECIES: HDIG domain-containing metalloprotein [unclassified Dysgonomonas]|uniref:HD family phosphohydrolase n=1 Tax=unclassified Dysgonomonas TaxID=2630389 RepID=UPI0025C0B360|nr:MULTISPECIES: HDIG domain-containing metalloprotein [unclassified Dysgonomonas]MDR2001565.1 HDIG domain-containing protein [Prevotella sp.]HMM02833.1 HDIG domain-containing protein [Dysgonomonas sp.]